ncbi:MAG TPA: hypothetical protein VNC61_16050 [Acidimicrobiales bacterium]|nr:hypothetical protein [Acidimicrobiales bacterium]
MRGSQLALQTQTIQGRFLYEAALGVAQMMPEDLEPGNLTIPFGVSVWIRRSDIGLADACDAMLELRTAFLAVSGLDQRSEPVPLLGGDRRTAVLNLAVYLDGLVNRGARCAGTSRMELAQAALELLDP